MQVTSMTILMIDDNNDTKETISKLISPIFPVNFILAENLEIGLAKNADQLPEIIILNFLAQDEIVINSLIAFKEQNKNINNIIVLTEQRSEDLKKLTQINNVFDVLLKDKYLEERLLNTFTKIKITKQRQQNNRLDQGLDIIEFPNEELFKQMLLRTLARAKRYNRITSLIIFEIDDLVELMKSLDNKVAYQLAWNVSEILQNNVRSSDTIFRLNIKQFAIILEEISDNFDAGLVARKLMSLFEAPIEIGEESIQLNCSLGLTCYPDGVDDVKLYYNQAIMALIRAKQVRNKNSYFYFSDHMYQADQHQIKITSDLTKALDKNEFYLLYQPIYHLRYGDVLGFECLLRWDHPSLDIIGPKAFLPLADKVCLGNEICYWIFDRAVNDSTQWNSDKSQEKLLFLKVPAKTITDKNNVEKLDQYITQSRLKRKNIVLAITESVLEENSHNFDLINRHFSKLACQVCVENFGVGNLSISDLQRCNVNYIKLDKSLISNLFTVQDNQIIVTTILSMAQNLSIDIIASGIETKQQLKFLQDKNCHYGLGYHLSSPVEAKKIKKLLDDDNNQFAKGA